MSALNDVEDLLMDLREYLDQYADVDDGTPNTEMTLLARIEALLPRVRATEA